MNNTTTELQWGDVIFKPGQRVRTTDASDYAGLDGVIICQKNWMILLWMK